MIFICMNCCKLLTPLSAIKTSCPGRVPLEDFGTNKDQHLRQLGELGEQKESWVGENGQSIQKHELISNPDMMKIVLTIRDKYRLCWKEIYLRFWSIMQEPELCSECGHYFQLNELGLCEGANPKNIFD